MSNQVDMHWKSHHQEVMQGVNAITQAMDKIVNKVDQIGKKQNSINQKNATGWQKMRGSITQSIASLAGFTSAVAAIYTAVQAVRYEFEKIVETGKEAKEINVTAGKSFARMNVNLQFDKKGTGGVENINQFNAMKQDTQAKTFLTDAEMNQVYSNTLSARGSLNINEMNEFVKSAGRLLPGDAEGIEMLASRAMDISKVTGESNADKIISSILQLQSASRAVKIDDLAENVMPAILGVMERGGSFQEAGAFFAGLTQLAGDISPEKSRTGSVRMIQELYEFMPKRRMEGERGRKVNIDKQDIQDYEDALKDGPIALSKVIRNSPELAEAFLQHAGAMGKGALLPAFRSYFLDKKQGRAEMDAAEKKVMPLGDGRALGEYIGRLDNLDASNQVMVMKQQKILELSDEAYAFSDQGVIRSQKVILDEAETKARDRHDAFGPDMIMDMVDKAIWSVSMKGDVTDLRNLAVANANRRLGTNQALAGGDEKGFASQAAMVEAIHRMDAVPGQPRKRGQGGDGKGGRRRKNK